jgi:hypothetical protein
VKKKPFQGMVATLRAELSILKGDRSALNHDTLRIALNVWLQYRNRRAAIVQEAMALREFSEASYREAVGILTQAHEEAEGVVARYAARHRIDTGEFVRQSTAFRDEQLPDEHGANIFIRDVAYRAGLAMSNGGVVEIEKFDSSSDLDAVRRAVQEHGSTSPPKQIIKALRMSEQKARRLLRELEAMGEYAGFARPASHRKLPFQTSEG